MFVCLVIYIKHKGRGIIEWIMRATRTYYKHEDQNIVWYILNGDVAQHAECHHYGGSSVSNLAGRQLRLVCWIIV